MFCWVGVDIGTCLGDCDGITGDGTAVTLETAAATDAGDTLEPIRLKILACKSSCFGVLSAGLAAEAAEF